MHTIEFDNATEQALNLLAASQGKSPDEWLRETTVKLIHSQSQVLPSMAELRASLPMQAVSASEFCRDMRDGERPEPSTLPPLASLIGKGQGCFRDAAEVDAFLRSERDSWEDCVQGKVIYFGNIPG